jgi:hypothetical protein
MTPIGFEIIVEHVLGGAAFASKSDDDGAGDVLDVFVEALELPAAERARLRRLLDFALGAWFDGREGDAVLLAIDGLPVGARVRLHIENGEPVKPKRVARKGGAQ